MQLESGAATGVLIELKVGLAQCTVKGMIVAASRLVHAGSPDTVLFAYIGYIGISTDIQHLTIRHHSASSRRCIPGPDVFEDD